MKKIICYFLVSLIFIFAINPLFCLAATAPFTFETSLSQPTLQSNQLGYVVATSNMSGVYVILSFTPGIIITGGPGLELVSSSHNNLPYAQFYTTSTGSIQYNLSFYDLLHGNLLTTETATNTITVGGAPNWDNLLTVYFDRIFTLDNYLTGSTSDYCYYSLGNSYRLRGPGTATDPFVNWNSSDAPGSGGSGGGESGEGTTDPSGGTSIVRSRIPRPLGNNLVYYIADHENLYSIFVGHPFLFETQGKIDTSLSPEEYEGENYNQFSVMISGSSNGVNVKFTNKCQYAINCYINKYDVVDGSFKSSYSTTVNAGSLDTPSIHNYNLVLSDASTYGIYQSGIFSRDGLTNYPELRISWSDTIDYTSDLFAIQNGITAILSNQSTIISTTSSINSTVSTISSTTQSILTAINSFYSLVSDNWTWFKTTFYNNLNQKWSVTNEYLIAIYDLLNETEEEATINDDTSKVDEMESAKNDLVVTNSSGQVVNAGDAAAAGLSEAAQQIGEVAQPVSVINQLMQTIVFDKPKLLLPLIVALGLGLMVTILGKNKSD